MPGAGARAAPLAALVAIAAVAMAGRVLRPASIAPDPSVSGRHGAGARAASGSPGTASLAGSLPQVAARRVEHAPRALHGDARRTHRARGHGPRTARLAWSYEADGPIEAQVTTSPDEQTLYVATLAGTLLALGRDGTRRWSVPLEGRAYATPCVADDGTIYAGSDAHKLYAVTAEGRVKWKIETDGDADTGAFVGADGAVVFAAGKSVFAVRPGGDLAWRFTAKGKVFTAPALADGGLVVFGSQDDHVYALSPGGALAWWADLGADVDGSPAIGDDGGIFVGTDGQEIVRLDAKGSVVWRTDVGGYVRGSLSIARNGDVVAGVYGPSPRVVRVGADGRVRGSFAVQGTGAREFGVHGGPLEDDDGTLYFGAQDDAFYAVGLTGEPLWRFPVGDDADAPATLLSDGTLIVASDDGKVYALGP